MHGSSDLFILILSNNLCQYYETSSTHCDVDRFNTDFVSIVSVWMHANNNVFTSFRGGKLYRNITKHLSF